MKTEQQRMNALQAFELLLKCTRARKADGGVNTGSAYRRQVAEKDEALDAVINLFGAELRRILTPAFDEEK